MARILREFPDSVARWIVRFPSHLGQWLTLFRQRVVIPHQNGSLDFSDSLVDFIALAPPDLMPWLSSFIQGTIFTEGHEKVISAWTARRGVVGPSSDLGVTASLREQELQERLSRWSRRAQTIPFA